MTDSDLAVLAQQVEESIRAGGNSQVTARDVGLAILPHLRKLDDVAYLRFASVYEDFASLDDFAAAIAAMRQARVLDAEAEPEE